MDVCGVIWNHRHHSVFEFEHTPKSTEMSKRSARNVWPEEGRKCFIKEASKHSSIVKSKYWYDAWEAIQAYPFSNSMTFGHTNALPSRQKKSTSSCNQSRNWFTGQTMNVVSNTNERLDLCEVLIMSLDKNGIFSGVFWTRRLRQK